MSEMKVCFKCGGDPKPLSDFYKHPQMKDGHLNKCKVCTKGDVGKHRGENLDKIREYDRERANLPHRKKLNTETTKRMRENNPEAYKAHTALNNAIRDGKIIKPKVCSACNKERRLHGHHDDYSKPLEVEWLCTPCHKDHHKVLEKETT